MVVEKAGEEKEKVCLRGPCRNRKDEWCCDVTHLKESAKEGKKVVKERSTMPSSVLAATHIPFVVVIHSEQHLINL